MIISPAEQPFCFEVETSVMSAGSCISLTLVSDTTPVGGLKSFSGLGSSDLQVSTTLSTAATGLSTWLSEEFNIESNGNLFNSDSESVPDPEVLTDLERDGDLFSSFCSFFFFFFFFLFACFFCFLALLLCVSPPLSSPAGCVFPCSSTVPDESCSIFCSISPSFCALCAMGASSLAPVSFTVGITSALFTLERDRSSESDSTPDSELLPDRERDLFSSFRFFFFFLLLCLLCFLFFFLGVSLPSLLPLSSPACELSAITLASVSG